MAISAEAAFRYIKQKNPNSRLNERKDVINTDLAGVDFSIAFYEGNIIAFIVAMPIEQDFEYGRFLFACNAVNSGFPKTKVFFDVNAKSIILQFTEGNRFSNAMDFYGAFAQSVFILVRDMVNHLMVNLMNEEAYIKFSSQSMKSATSKLEGRKPAISM